MATSLYKALDMTMSKTDVINWDNLVGMLNIENSTYKQPVSETDAVMYSGDFYGLLLNVFKIESAYLYPNLLANGFTSPSEYGRNIREVRILESEALKKMLLTINKKM